jgi:alpha-beta hydrolase superfamily lysophospholipase
MMRRLLSGFALMLAVACAPLQQGALPFDSQPQANFSDTWFTSFDGARLGLSTWRPAPPEPLPPECGARADRTVTPTEIRIVTCDTHEDIYGKRPETVIIAVHGMNDYASAFNAAGTWWSEHGAIVYAYDQRGFGRSPQSGIWPKHEVMRKDLKIAVDVARRLHPGARIAVVGESMGASVAITAFADPDRPRADVLVLSGPGLYGWGALPWYYSMSLWTSAHVRPDWVVVPPKGIIITPTDNNEKQREMWYDPNVQKTNRIDSVYGVVSIMEEAYAKISKLPKSAPTLLLYGAKDEVIPPYGVERAAKKLPRHVRTAYYLNGYHMLMNDLQAETVWSDVLSFIERPDAPLPSGSPPLPWARSDGAPLSATR